MKYIIAFLAVCLISLTAAAQKITTDKVPVLVGRAYKSMFPQANQQSWSLEGKGVYEVDFFNAGKKQSATFDSTGAWIETETEIKLAQLPRTVSAAFYRQFPGYAVQEVLEVETAAKGTLYELTVNKGSDGYEVQFSAKGELVRKEKAREED